MSARTLIGCLSLGMLLALGHLSSLAAQTEDAAAQQATAERFLEILLKRPQTGTALDKTVEHYQSIGKFEELVERIKSQAKELSNSPADAARHWLAAALIVQSQSRWLVSLELLQQAPDIAQQRWDVGLSKSVALENLQRWPAVVDVLQPLIQSVQDDPKAVTGESLIHAAQRLAKAYSRTGQSKESLKVWQMLEERFGDDQPIAMRLANMAANEGELSFAIEVLDRILARMPPSTKRVELVIQRTGLLARSGDEDTAIANYQSLLKGVNVDSWLATDITRRLEDLIVAKDGNDALIKYYRTQTAQRPDDTTAKLRLATLLNNEKRWDESNELFKQLIERTPSSIEPRKAYAQSLIHQEQWHLASQEFQKIAAMAPRDDDVLMQWCEAILADNSLEVPARDAQVQRLLERSIEGVPASADKYLQLAGRLQKFGQTSRALEWLSKAYQLQPKQLSVVSDYARALADAGQEQASLSLLAEYQRANETHRDELAQLADVYRDLGQAELAVQCLGKACDLGATPPLRFRLSEWLEAEGRGLEALEQLDLAWSELPSQTKVDSEQELLCEEIVRRQVDMLARQDSLAKRIATMQAEQKPSSSAPRMAGLPADALADWRLAKLLVKNNQWESADQLVETALKQNPSSTLIWRLRAELDEQTSSRLPEAVVAHRKLAELDVRRRSEYLLHAAKDLARMGKVDAALKETELITTETASSQLIVDVFNLANEYGANRFAIDLLQKRLLARPGDLDVLSRLIEYHLEKGAFQLAADYQWQRLELMRTAQQREAAVQLLIEIHHQMRSVGALEKKLDKFWRQQDLWREFGVWQVLIALKTEDYARAEKLLDRLVQSEATRRFGLDQSLMIARLQNQSLKQFQLMKQLASIEAETVTAGDLTKVLAAIQFQDLSRDLARDALGMMRGPGKRLAIIHDLLLAAKPDLALRLIEMLPEQEQNSWPIISRTALALALYPEGSETLPHVEHARSNLDQFVDRSLELSPSLSGEPLLEELFGSRVFIVEFFITTTLYRQYASSMQSINGEATDCSSKVRAYQAVIAAELHLATTPKQKRDVWERHRAAAMKQADPRERAVRLAALAIVANWHAKAPATKDVLSEMESITAQVRGRQVELVQSLHIEFKKWFHANLPDVNPNDAGASLAAALADCSQSLQNLAIELNDLADQGESLAALLALWNLGFQNREQLGPNSKTLLDRAVAYAANLADYKTFAPAKLATLIALKQAKNQPRNSQTFLESLSKLHLNQEDHEHLFTMALREGDAEMLEILVRALAPRMRISDFLGDLVSSRGKLDMIDNSSASSVPGRSKAVLSVLQALDAVWKFETDEGVRAIETFSLPASKSDAHWVKVLPICSLPMHASSLFQQVDFDVLRAIVAQAPSNAARQELLKELKQLAEKPANDSLKLVRSLALVFVWELLEQDTQSTKLLDEALPPSRTNPRLALLRVLWLDLTGRRDSAIEWALQLDRWPRDIREGVAAVLLEIALAQHHDQGIDLAVKQLVSATSDLAAYRQQVTALLERNQLAQAEALIGIVRVFLPPVKEPLDVILRFAGRQANTPAVNISGRNSSGLTREIETRWQQTELLLQLVRRYSQADDAAGASRVARQLIEGAQYASDDEMRTNLIHLITRLEDAFVKKSHIDKFLELESQRLQESYSVREAICILQMLVRAKRPELARGVVARIAAGGMNALQYLEVGKCEVQLGAYENAALLLARAFEMEPDWLETSIASLSESKLNLALLAKELNKKANAGAGLGVLSMNAFLNAMRPGELSECSQLLMGWATNSLPKTPLLIRSILTRAQSENFELWLLLVEQLLLTNDLQATTVAYTNAEHWVHRQNTPGLLEQQLLEPQLDLNRDAQYRAMLESVLVRAPDHFVARLVLTRNLLSAQQLDRAAGQLPALLQSFSGREAIKKWLVENWNAELTQYGRNPVYTRALALRQRSLPVVPAEIDKAAKVKLMVRLLDSWPVTQEQSQHRAQILSLLADQGYTESLTATQIVEMMGVHASNKDEAKVLALFEQDFVLLSANLPAGPLAGKTFAPDASLNLLGAHGMNWVRHLILVRWAQFEKLPLQKSGAYRAQLNYRLPPGTASYAIDYPMKTLDANLLLRYIDTVRLQLSAGSRTTKSDPWIEPLKPRLVVDAETRTVQTVSMLDALWPLGTQLNDEDVRQRLLAELKVWNKNLDTLGPWSVLALHNLAARLGDIAIVQSAQERMLEMASSKNNIRDVDWEMSCWSAVLATTDMPSIAQSRIRLGELARQAAAQDPTIEIHLLISLEQFESLKIHSTPGGKVLRQKIEQELATAQPRGGRGAWLTPDRAAQLRLEVNGSMFDSLMAEGETEQAVELLKSVQSFRPNGSGMIPTDRPFRTAVELHRSEATIAAFQRLIDKGWQTEKMQGVWEDLLRQPSAQGLQINNSSDFGDLSVDRSNPAAPLKWRTDFDVNQPLAEVSLPLNMYSQLVQLAHINHELNRLKGKLVRNSRSGIAYFVCGTMLAIEQKNIREALSIYREVSESSERFNQFDLNLVRDTIFNAIRLQPLSDEAWEYSSIALQRSANAASVDLLRQQLTLAIKQPATFHKVVAIVDKASLPADIRHGLRVEAACGLLENRSIKSSLEAYVELQPNTEDRPREADRYLLMLLNRLPALTPKEQAELFEFFVSRKFSKFPWLVCYPVASTQPLPDRFRNPETKQGLALQAIDRQSSWVSLLMWIADYAERTGQANVAIEAATFNAVDNQDAGFGAAALVSRLNPQFTPGALKNRLALAGPKVTPADLRALLDCCQQNESLRAVAVEFILNLGFPEIALSAPANLPQANNEATVNGWKHWITVREVNLKRSENERSRWSLAKNGQWTAQAARNAWYLMLRYPIEGDFQLNVTAQQVSGAKFGIGYGGLTAAQPESNALLRCLGVGERTVGDLMRTFDFDGSEVPLQVSRQGANWSLQAASVVIEEQSVDFVPFVHLVNQGAGVARMDGWRLSNELKIARQVSLLDSQLRWWRSSIGTWKLPALRVQTPGLDRNINHSESYVDNGVLQLGSLGSKQSEATSVCNAMHCLRPLLEGETIAYEFYRSDDSAIVHAALGRMIFRLDDTRLKLQWLTHPDEVPWLGISSSNSFPLDASESVGPVKLKPDAWNRVQLTRTTDDLVVIELNGKTIVKMPLPKEVVKEFGLVVVEPLPAKVQQLQLSGPWPQTLNLEQLMEVGELGN